MASWTEQPIVDVANGVIWADEEGRLCGELAQVEWDVELFPYGSLWVGQKWKRQVTQRGFESSQFFSSTRPDSDDGATYGGEQVVLFFERKAAAFARG